MTFVIDASATLSWAFDDEAGSLSKRSLARLLEEGESAHAPLLWWIEIRAVLVANERRKRTTEQRSTAFLGLLSRLPITLHALPEEGALLSLARRCGLTVYDATYVELANRLSLPLLTLDRAMRLAAKAEAVEIVT